MATPTNKQREFNRELTSLKTKQVTLETALLDFRDKARRDNYYGQKHQIETAVKACIECGNALKKLNDEWVI